MEILSVNTFFFSEMGDAQYDRDDQQILMKSKFLFKSKGNMTNRKSRRNIKANNSAYLEYSKPNKPSMVTGGGGSVTQPEG